jgi:hypothetical protein
MPLAGPSNVRGYELKRRGLGGFEGLAIGTLLGFVAGAVIGLAVTSDDPPCEDPHLCVRFASRQKALLAGGLGAALGLVIGRQIGADIGHTDRYLFVND